MVCRAGDAQKQECRQILPLRKYVSREVYMRYMGGGEYMRYKKASGEGVHEVQ